MLAASVNRPGGAVNTPGPAPGSEVLMRPQNSPAAVLMPLYDGVIAPVAEPACAPRTIPDLNGGEV
jgi:hypothetical protein